MKVLLHVEALKGLNESGLGQAINHQKKALNSVNIDYTLNKNDTYDLAHLNFYLIDSALLARRLKKQGVPIVYHAHSTKEDFRDSFWFSKIIGGIYFRWLLHCYNYGTVLITPTEYSKKLLESYGIKKKIFPISNGIDLDYFKRDKKEGEFFRKTYGYSKKDKVIVGIGLYFKRKGILEFVELAKRLPEYKFIWFGHTSNLLIPHEIRKIIKNHPDNLTFAGYVDKSMIRSALSGCDLYIFPTHEETEGIPAVEACAMKTDMIVSNIPVFSPWLKDGVNTYMAKDVDEFEDKIKKIINKELPSLVEEGYKVAVERDSKLVGKKLKQAYEEAIKLAKNKK